MADTKPEAEAMTPELDAYYWARYERAAVGGEKRLAKAEAALRAALSPKPVLECNCELKHLGKPCGCGLGKPVEVAPDDEAAAHLYSIEKLCNEVALTMNGGRVYLIGEARQAIEALRRHIAGLREELATERDLCSERTRLWVDAKAALAACRDKTIEECAAQAESLRHLDYSSESPEWCSGTEDAATAIRALKTKEPTNG